MSATPAPVVSPVPATKLHEPTTASPPSKTAHWPVWARFLLLNAGLLLYGISLAAMIRAGVGLAPWDAFHVGLARVVPGFTIGRASIAVGLVAQLTAYRYLGMPFGVGSALNLVLIGLYIDLFRPQLPVPANLLAAWLMFIGGTLGVGLATGTYIASNFGAGPRDSLVLGMARRTNWPVKWLRSGTELLVLAAGWAMGAQVGWGTLVFALVIGPAMSAGLALYGLRR